MCSIILATDLSEGFGFWGFGLGALAPVGLDWSCWANTLYCRYDTIASLSSVLRIGFGIHFRTLDGDIIPPTIYPLPGGKWLVPGGRLQVRESWRTSLAAWLLST